MSVQNAGHIFSSIKNGRTVKKTVQVLTPFSAQFGKSPNIAGHRIKTAITK